MSVYTAYPYRIGYHGVPKSILYTSLEAHLFIDSDVMIILIELDPDTHSNASTYEVITVKIILTCLSTLHPPDTSKVPHERHEEIEFRALSPTCLPGCFPPCVQACVGTASTSYRSILSTVELYHIVMLMCAPCGVGTFERPSFLRKTRSVQTIQWSTFTRVTMVTRNGKIST